MAKPSKEQIQLFNQHFQIKKIFAKLTIYELNVLRDYYFEYETTKPLENEYHKTAYGNYILDNREIIYHRQTEQKVKHKFKAPIEFVNKLKIVHRMRQCYLTKPLTYMVYQIMQKILTEPKDFDLLYQCLYPTDPSEGIKRCKERSQYKALCEKYGKPEIQYLFKQHFQ